MNHPAGKRIVILAAPVLLIAAGLIATWAWLRTGDRTALESGVTYLVWLEEAETSPVKADGRAWDSDGSGPDLFGIVTWQDVRILETVTAADGLIARWEPVAMSISQLAKGEADTASVQRVGRFRHEEEGFLEVGIFDRDPVGADFAGAFRIPMSSLRVGRNRMTGPGQVRRFHLRISTADEGPVAHPSDRDISRDVVELDDVPPAMRDTGRRVSDSIREQADELERQSRDIGDKVKDWIGNPTGR